MLFLVNLNPEYSSSLLVEAKGTCALYLVLLAAKKKAVIVSFRRTPKFWLPIVLRAQLPYARRNVSFRISLPTQLIKQTILINSKVFWTARNNSHYIALEFQIHVSVRILTIKFSQWARVKFRSYRFYLVKITGRTTGSHRKSPEVTNPCACVVYQNNMRSAQDGGRRGNSSRCFDSIYTPKTSSYEIICHLGSRKNIAQLCSTVSEF